jgi:hypothetical protein
MEKFKGTVLGELTSELTTKTGENHITVHVAPGPKDYSCELDDGTVKMKTKGIIMKAEAEEKITLNKKLSLIKGAQPEAIKIFNLILIKLIIKLELKNK